MKKHIIRLQISSTLFLGSALFPFVAFAQQEGIQKLDQILTLFNRLIPIVFVIALLYFLWGLTLFISSSSESSTQTKAKDMMIWGVLILVVMVSVWAIVWVVRRTFGINDNNQSPNDYPTFNARQP